MGKCQNCGHDTQKLVLDFRAMKEVCVKCINSKETVYPLEDEEVPAEDDKRSHVRIPIAVGLSFSMREQKRLIEFPATTVDVSMGGLCFAWSNCEKCTGYKEQGIHKNCFFYPYAIQNKNAEKIRLKLYVTPQKEIKVYAFAVYTKKEDDSTEYVGIKFAEVPPESERILETIVIKHSNI